LEASANKQLPGGADKVGNKRVELILILLRVYAQNLANSSLDSLQLSRFIIIIGLGQWILVGEVFVEELHYLWKILFEVWWEILAAKIEKDLDAVAKLEQEWCESLSVVLVLLEELIGRLHLQISRGALSLEQASTFKSSSQGPQNFSRT
jgi:hypothetical protein